MRDMMRTFISVYYLFYLGLFAQATVDLSKDPAVYGVDCSYPIHYGINKKDCPYFYDQYQKMIQGCYKLYSKSECEANDVDRLRMNRDQPKTQHNYTVIGFKHIKAPKEAFDAIKQFYEANKANAKTEKWYRGSTIVNNWESPTEMVSFENPSFRGGYAVKQLIWDSVKPVVEEWVGHKVEPTSLYGVRIYHEGSVLATHVDRLPLVSSAIINVDQDLDEPWPVEVYDHVGRAYNITMQPGDMVLYESATVLHGRPFPLKGRHYANVFVHYQPIDHEEMNRKDEELRNEPLAIPRRHGGNTRALRSKEQIMQAMTREQRFMHAAATGDSDTLHSLLSEDPKLIHYKDGNDWEALHEAIRAGKLDEVKYLIEAGADISAKIRGGGSALWLARKTLPDNHPVTEYLISIGAPES